MATIAPARIIRTDAHDDGVNAWTMTRMRPGVPLASSIRSYCDYTERTGGFTTRRELPHAEGVLIVNLGDPIFITGGDGREITLGSGEAFVAGVHLRPALSRSGGAQTGIQIDLPLETVRRLLGIPMDEIVDRVIPLDALLGSAARALCEELAETNDPLVRATLLDAALFHRLRTRPSLPFRQMQALYLLRQHADLDITAVAHAVGWSRKHLADRIRDAIGVGPRSFRRLLRFQRLTGTIAAAPPADWAGLAHDAGYCDQSHMIREFREFADLTPGQYVARSIDGGGLIEC